MNMSIDVSFIDRYFISRCVTNLKKKKLKHVKRNIIFPLQTTCTLYTRVYIATPVRVLNTPLINIQLTQGARSLSFSQAMDKLESVSWIEEPPTCHDQGIHTDTNNYVFNLQSCINL